MKLPRLAPFLYEAVWIVQKYELGSSSKNLKICRDRRHRRAGGGHDGIYTTGKGC